MGFIFSCPCQEKNLKYLFIIVLNVILLSKINYIRKTENYTVRRKGTVSTPVPQVQDAQQVVMVVVR